MSGTTDSSKPKRTTIERLLERLKASFVGFWSHCFPHLENRTDRLVRRLIIANLIFLVYVSVMASDSATVFAAFIAANAVGAIGGLLFAVPKQAALGTSQTSTGQTVAIVANTSLEEVSDWLTKTIIGAGLVSWRQILSQLDESGRILGLAMLTSNPDISRAAGVALILGPAGLGALIGYLWFARHWPSELAGTTKTTHEMLAELSKLAAAGQMQEPKPAAPEKPDIPPPAPSDGTVPEAAAAAPEAPAAGEESEGVEAEPAEEADEASAEQVAATVPNAAIKLRQVAELKYGQMRSAPLYRHDWARGMFGGSANVTNDFGTRALIAQVQRLEGEWFEVSLQLVAVPIPATEAIFFLHNTFPQPTPTVGFDEKAVARLKVTAYGAFTVGALTDDGTTELELNLADLEFAPSEFRNR